MNDSRLTSLVQIESFLNGSGNFVFERKIKTQEETYAWVQDALIRFGYIQAKKKHKGIIRKYIGKITGYSRAQVTRLIEKYVRCGRVQIKEYNRHKFNRIYSDGDIRLLAHADEIHDYPNGAALKKIFKRMAAIYRCREYVRLSGISVTQIYNFRHHSSIYRRLAKRYEKTKPVVVNIGERRKPEPDGKPGYLRVDTVHQGDEVTKGKTGESEKKGVYHINIIDEVTQFEFIGSAEKISEAFLIPILEKLIECFPFIIIEFHADNGGEYINYQVANMLNNLLIKLTKSRSRKTNDNALVEGKNGSIIRKWMGYGYIAQKHADRINHFYFNFFNEYVNFHRPCGYAVLKEDRNKKGRIRKVYPADNYRTPYEKLKSLPNANIYLKEGISFSMLDKMAMRYTDNRMAEIIQRERGKLFDEIIWQRKDWNRNRSDDLPVGKTENE